MGTEMIVLLSVACTCAIFFGIWFIGWTIYTSKDL